MTPEQFIKDRTEFRRKGIESLAKNVHILFKENTGKEMEVAEFMYDLKDLVPQYYARERKLKGICELLMVRGYHKI